MQGAYERGHNDGLGRNQMDTSFITRCPAELQQQQYQAYNHGYQEGIQHAPQVQVRYTQPTAQVYVVGQPLVTSCTFSSDCGASMHCRSWGGQGNVCMGYGSTGAPCWFGSDCASGWCNGGTANARTCQ